MSFINDHGYKVIQGEPISGLGTPIVVLGVLSNSKKREIQAERYILARPNNPIFLPKVFVASTHDYGSELAPPFGEDEFLNIVLQSASMDLWAYVHEEDGRDIDYPNFESRDKEKKPDLALARLWVRGIFKRQLEIINEKSEVNKLASDLGSILRLDPMFAEKKPAKKEDFG